MAESRDITAEHARAAAEIDADVSLERIADVYAAAALGAGEKTGRTDEAIAELDALIDELFARFPKLEAILASALVSHEEKCEILDRVLGGRASNAFLNFLKVVSRHGRLDCIRVIRRQAWLQYDRLRGRVRVQLRTALPVDDAAAATLVREIAGAVGGEPVLERVVDPGLIGGAVVRVGDIVHDASIANQLKTIRRQMIDRSAHEIQSRRDRFRNSAGN